MDGLPLDHVAIAVPSIERAAELYERLSGARCSTIETLPEQGVRVAFVGALELLEPIHPDTAVGRFLKSRGTALHHVAYRTTDLAADLARFREQGLQLIDDHPRPGARGHQVAFLHPSGTGGILVELVEHRE